MLFMYNDSAAVRDAGSERLLRGLIEGIGRGAERLD
jgi:hypothetical protein